jgi:hypothetical protein
MIAMEFDELKKIWDTQNNKPMYVINEEALHNRVKAKKNSAKKIANWMETMLIGANLFAGSILLYSVVFKGKENETYIYIMMCAMFITPLYLFYKRMQRKKVENRFELTMLGDIDHALSNATYSVVLSRTMQVYFAFIAILTMMSLIFDKDSSIITISSIGVVFIFGLYASRWEHKMYKNKEKELTNLKHKLEEDE